MTQQKFVLFDDFDVICRVKSNPSVLSAFAPALLVFIFKFLESVTYKIIWKTLFFIMMGLFNKR